MDDVRHVRLAGGPFDGLEVEVDCSIAFVAELDGETRAARTPADFDVLSRTGGFESYTPDVAPDADRSVFHWRPRRADPAEETREAWEPLAVIAAVRQGTSVPPLQLVLARAVRAERARARLTQAELGSRLGWARSTISAIESGDRELLAAELPAVCRVLDVSLRDLLRDADPRDLESLGL